MIIGIPKEIKQDEFRISLPPDKVHLLKENGHKVLIEAGAGLGAGIKDEVYSRAGATIVDDRLEIFGEAKMIIKVKAPPGKRSEVRELADVFRGRIVDVSADEVTIEISGQERKIEAFIELMRPFGITELVRTGRIAMIRSVNRSASIAGLKKYAGTDQPA